jgi:predicted nucleotidyltransferase
LTFILILCIVFCMKELTKIGIQNILEQNKEFIQSKFHITEIGLFGSFATGENTSDSDIDILVDFHKGHKDFFNFMRLKNFLERVLERKVDMVMKSAIRPQLKKSIFSQVQYV